MWLGGRCLGKKKKMLLFGWCGFCDFVRGICVDGGRRGVMRGIWNMIL